MNASSLEPNALSRVQVLVDNNPASFVLCPANGIPVTSFYDDPHGEWSGRILV